MPFVLLVHLLMSFWMYGDSSTLQSNFLGEERYNVTDPYDALQVAKGFSEFKEDLADPFLGAEGPLPKMARNNCFPIIIASAALGGAIVVWMIGLLPYVLKAVELTLRAWATVLMTFIKGILTAMRSVGSTLVLLFMLLYCFSAR